jgi:hypothetical protein
LIKEQVVKIYAKGDRVSQAQYGPGTITDANAMHTVIDFDQHGVRRFVTSLVVLETTTEPAPVRAKAKRASKRTVKPVAESKAS